MRLGARTLRFRSRKTLALLAYLVLEPRPHTRNKLADLLWPQALDGSGRASLRNALAQINTEIGAGLVRSSRDTVSWDAPVLETDVGLLEDASRLAGDGDATPELEARLARAAHLCRGELLEGLGFEDALDFDDWLLARREIAHGLLDAVLERLSALYAASGRAGLALETAQRRVRLEPLSESAHRGVIELHLRAGDRAAALEAYWACQGIFERELGLEPDAQTRALVERLLEPGPRPPPTQTIPPSAPLTVAGGVRLVGRAAVLGRMEAAWRAGQHIFVAGEPGAGKTSLILEFANGKGAFVAYHGRPGDGAVPFSSMARGLRGALGTHPNLELPDWVREELSRLMPELGGERLPPLSSHEDRLRLFEAVSRVDEELRGRDLYPLGDDFQFFDDSSMELIAYTFANAPTGINASSVAAFRPEEVSIRFKEIMRQMVEAGRAVVIELPPLEPGDVGEMLSALMPQGANLTDLGAALHRFTGGNPMFVLETVRALAEQGGLETLTAERFENRRRVAGLPRTPKVQTIIQRRLERLSAPALDLARVAAVMGEDFTLELGAKVLETPVLEVSRTAVELEAAQVWRGVRFSHDLLFETTFENIPESFSPLLHGSVLDALDGVGVPAAVLARHAHGAGRVEEALRHSLRAGLDAFALHALTEAADHLERVRVALCAPPAVFDPRSVVSDLERWQAYSTLFECYQPNGLHRPAAREEVLTELLAFEAQACDPHVKQNIQRLRAETQAEKTRDAAALMTLLRTQLEEARRDQDGQQEFDRLMDIGYLELPSAAKETYSAALNAAQELGYERGIGMSLMETARMDLLIGDWNEADAGFERASRHISPQDRRATIQVRWLRAWNWLWLGRSREAVTALRSHLPSWQALEDHARDALTRSWLSLALLETGECGEALEMARQADDLSPTMPFYRDLRLIFTVSVRLHLGQLDTARALLEGTTPAADWGYVSLTHTWEYQLAVMSCALHALRQDWVLACQHAVNAFERRPRTDLKRHILWSLLGHWFETEALLRGGQEVLAREELRRFGETVGPYQRLRISYLRSLAVLEAWDGHLESAIGHLEEAGNLALEMNLSSERWQIEARRAELFEANGDLEKARQARTCALEITNALAEGIADATSRTVFLEFARRLIGQNQRVSASW